MVLLLLTDGDITDTNSSAEALRRASNLPLSVIVVQTSTMANNAADEKLKQIGKINSSFESGYAYQEKMQSLHKRLSPSKQLPDRSSQPNLAPDTNGQAGSGKEKASPSRFGPTEAGQGRTGQPRATIDHSVEEPGRNVYHYIKYEEKPDESRADHHRGYLNSVSELTLAEEVFKLIPKQFLEYMARANIAPQKSSDSKAKSAKKEIKEKMAKKKFLAPTSVHPIVAHLKTLEEKFIRDIKRVGYEESLVDCIFREGIPASDFNLFAEIIAEKQNQNLELEQKPIEVPQPDQELGGPATSSQNLAASKTSFFQLEPARPERASKKADLHKLEPTVSKLYTKDKIPKKKFEEW